MTPVAHRWKAYWVCVGIAALTIMDMTKVNVALPAIEHSIHANSTQLQLVVSGYVLTFGLTLVPAGRLGDQRSRKTLFLIGLTVFTVMSVVAGFATDPTMLLVARLLQGVGAGIQMPQVMGSIQQLFQGAERGRAFGLFGAAIGLATAFGPTLGGALIAAGGPDWGWRLMFLINLPLGIIAIVATVLLLPADRNRAVRTKLSMDPVGIALFAVVVVSLMWPFLFTTGRPTDDPNRWWILVVCAVFLVLFALWEHHYAKSGRHPIIPLRLLRIVSFRNGVLVSSLYFAAMPSMFLVSTLFLQDGLGVSAMVAGMTTISFAAVSGLTAWIGGLLVARYGRLIVVSGIAMVIISVVLLILVVHVLPASAIPWGIAVVMILGGAGGGFVISPNQTLMLTDIEVSEGGLAGSVGQLGQRVGNAIGAAVALSIFYSTMFRESGSVPAEKIPYDAYTNGMLAAGGVLVLALIAALADLLSKRRRVVD